MKILHNQIVHNEKRKTQIGTHEIEDDAVGFLQTIFGALIVNTHKMQSCIFLPAVGPDPFLRTSPANIMITKNGQVISQTLNGIPINLFQKFRISIILVMNTWQMQSQSGK